MIFLSYCIFHAFIEGCKYVGAGLAAVSISGTGAGIGTIFSGLLVAFSRNPNRSGQLFSWAIFGFALTEAIALFGLMITLVILV